MKYTIFNQTTQPQELSDGQSVGANANCQVAQISERERSLEAAGVIFIREIKAEAEPSNEAAPVVQQPKRSK
jgi:hypothetical protein